MHIKYKFAWNSLVHAHPSFSVLPFYTSIVERQRTSSTWDSWFMFIIIQNVYLVIEEVKQWPSAVKTKVDSIYFKKYITWVLYAISDNISVKSWPSIVLAYDTQNKSPSFHNLLTNVLHTRLYRVYLDIPKTNSNLKTH